MKRFRNWLADKISPEKASRDTIRSRPGAGPARKPAHTSRPAPRKATDPGFVDFDATVNGMIDDLGPGKNVLRRPKYVREEAGTHDTLSIVDEYGNNESSNDADGIDPYNTGKFDRSKNWDKRFRKD